MFSEIPDVELPFPSARSFPITSASFKHQRQQQHKVFDKTKLTRTPTYCCHQVSKRKKKFIAFTLIVIIQLLEIFFLTISPVDGYNQFYARPMSR